MHRKRQNRINNEEHVTSCSSKKGGRRTRGISESRIISERRPLFSIQLAPPDYDVPPHILTDSYIEKEVRFAGIVSDVSKYVDATNRTDVLREIDRGKREKCVCWKTTFEEDAIFSLSVHNIKISRRDGDEKLQLRLAVHEVEAMSYIRDDDQHILCIKFALDECGDERDSETSDSSQLAVLYCGSRVSAEELCSMLNQCFQLVYTNNTMHFFDDKVNEAAAGMSLSSSTVKSESISNSKSTSRNESGYDSKPLGFLSQSTTDLVNSPSTLSSTRSRSLPRRPSNAQSNHGNILSDNEQLLQDYTRKLYDRLNVSELRQFAMLVKAWHTNMPFTEFCDQVLQLYGPDRKHLIIGMRPFIPEKDLLQFESFLERVGLHASSTAAGNGTLSSGSKAFRSSFSTPSTNTGAAAVATGTGPGQPDDYSRTHNTMLSNIDNVGNESKYLSGNT